MATEYNLACWNLRVCAVDIGTDAQFRFIGIFEIAGNRMIETNNTVKIKSDIYIRPMMEVTEE